MSVGKSPQQTKVVFINRCLADRTDRQKKERKARGETFVGQGLYAAKVKVARERRKPRHDGHDADCGSGLGPFHEVPIKTALAVEGTIRSVVACRFVDQANPSQHQDI